MIEWRERLANVLGVAVVLLAGGSLAIGIRNALFDATPLRAGSFSSDDVADLVSPVAGEPSPEAPPTTAAPRTTSSSTSTSLVRGTVPAPTPTTRAVAVTAGTTPAPTTSSTTSTTVDDNDGNRGRSGENRGRGKPEDD